MNISKKQKAETRVTIIKSAVDVITIKGYEKATMREISKKAKIADATIYKYFPTKEKILFTYFEAILDQSISIINKIDKFEDFTIQEKFQTLVETQLELFLADREFVGIAFKYVFDSALGSYTQISPIRNKFMQEVHSFLSTGLDKNEIPDQPFLNMIENLSWDFYLAIIVYWLKDDSDLFENTTQFIDKSLNIVYPILKEGLLSRISDLGSFLFKAHLYRYVEGIHEKKRSSKLINSMIWVREKIDNELKSI